MRRTTAFTSATRTARRSARVETHRREGRRIRLAAASTIPRLHAADPRQPVPVGRRQIGLEPELEPSAQAHRAGLSDVEASPPARDLHRYRAATCRPASHPSFSFPACWFSSAAPVHAAPNARITADVAQLRRHPFAALRRRSRAAFRVRKRGSAPSCARKALARCVRSPKLARWA